MNLTIADTDFPYKSFFMENQYIAELSNARMMIFENLTMMRRMKNDRTRIDPNTVPAIARRLRLLRKTVASSQTELCAQTEITRAAWSNYENANDRIGVDAAMKLCKTYGVTLDWIYFGDPEFLRSGLRDRIQATEKAEAKKEADEEKKTA